MQGLGPHREAFLQERGERSFQNYPLRVSEIEPITDILYPNTQNYYSLHQKTLILKGKKWVLVLDFKKESLGKMLTEEENIGSCTETILVKPFADS